MKQGNIAIGLDIGTTKVMAVVGRENEAGELEIISVGKAKNLGASRGIIDNILKTTNAIKKAKREAENRCKIEIDKIVVGIAGERISSGESTENVVIKGRDETIKQEDMDRLMDQVYEASFLFEKEIIHAIPQSFRVNHEAVSEPIGRHGQRLEANFHIVTGNTGDIRNTKTCLKNAGLGIQDIVLGPLASADAVLHEEEKDAGVALIDIGGGTTDLAIFKDGIMKYTAIIPFGGNAITKDIQAGCNIVEKYAEVIKINHGTAATISDKRSNEFVAVPGIRGGSSKDIPLKMVSTIINARVCEIFALVESHIRRWNENPDKQLLAGIVLTGGGAQLKDLKEVVSQYVGIATRIGTPNNCSADTKQIFKSTPYATAIGLTIKGLQKLKEQKYAKKN